MTKIIPKGYDPIILGGAFLIFGAILYMLLRGVKGAAKDVVTGGVGAVGDVGAGVVEGIGEVVGIPVTSTSPCEAACAAGQTWRASFDCSAARFLRYLKDGK